MKPNKPKMKTAKPIKRTTKKTVKKVVRKPKTAKTAEPIKRTTKKTVKKVVRKPKTAKTIKISRPQGRKKADPIEATLSALWDWWSKEGETPLSTMVDTTEVLRSVRDFQRAHSMAPRQGVDCNEAPLLSNHTLWLLNSSSRWLRYDAGDL